MCGECAPEGGWERRRFLTLAGAAVLGAGSAVPLGAWPVGAAAPAAGRPEILGRDAWAGDAAPAGPVPPEPDVRFLVVHHTVHANDYGEGDVVGLLRGMYRFHTGAEKTWPDIAYNFVVDRFGRIWEARAGSADGAVAGDATGGSQGFDQKCAFLGDHRTVAPSARAQEAMVALLAFLADRHRVDTAPGATTSFVSRGSNRHPEGSTVRTATLTGHRTMSTTACPGDAAMALVTDRFPGAVTARRAPATTTSTSTSSTAAATSAPTSSTAPTAAPGTSVDASTPVGAPVEDPLPWMVGGGALAVAGGMLLRARSRR